MTVVPARGERLGERRGLRVAALADVGCVDADQPDGAEVGDDRVAVAPVVDRRRDGGVADADGTTASEAASTAVAAHQVFTAERRSLAPR